MKVITPQGKEFDTLDVIEMSLVPPTLNTRKLEYELAITLKGGLGFFVNDEGDSGYLPSLMAKVVVDQGKHLYVDLRD